MKLPALQTNSLPLYFAEVSKFPVLSEDEEREVAFRWFDHQDLETAQKLVLANLRFVVKMAYEYVQYGFPMADVIQEGNIGLMKAVKKFDPNKGVRLISYAIFWIKAQIHEYIQKSWSMVRFATTKKQRDMFSMLQNSRSRLNRALVHGSAPEDLEKVAADLEVPVASIRDIQRRTMVRDISLDYKPQGEEGPSVADRLASTWTDPETELLKEDADSRFMKAIREIAPSLDERDRYILENRLLAEKPLLMDEIGAKYGVSRQRVDQIEKKLLKKLKAHLIQFGIDAA